MKFDAAKVPQTHELIGVSPLSGSDLENIKNLWEIRENASKRIRDLEAKGREIEQQSFALGRQFHQADLVLNGEVTKIAWRLGWDEVNNVIYDEFDQRIYGLRVKPEAIPSIYGQKP